jgi:nucleoside-diphosphate-sugar epimerase
MASSEKLQQAGWKPRHSVADGLGATVAYFQSLKA